MTLGKNILHNSITVLLSCRKLKLYTEIDEGVILYVATLGVIMRYQAVLAISGDVGRY